MGNVAVTITVEDEQVPAQPVNDVLIQVFDGDGDLQDSGSTGDGVNADGDRIFTLAGVVAGTAYTLRFAKVGVSMVKGSPQAISVTDPADPTNNFLAVADTFTLPTATDNSLCRCTGTFVDGAGQVIEGLRIFMTNRLAPPDPQILGAGDTAKGVLGTKVELVTNDVGTIQVDLIRNAEYDVIIAGQEDGLGTVVIPDKASVNLIHVLYPVISNVVYDPVSPAAATVGDTTSVDLTLTFSSGVANYTGAPPIVFTSSDAAIATASVTGTDQSDAEVVITGVAVGAATLTPKPVFASAGQEVVTLPALAALPAIVVNVT